MLLKAPSMFKNATRVYSLIPRDFSISATTELSAVSVDFPLEYACCETACVSGLSLFLMFFSKMDLVLLTVNYNFSLITVNIIAEKNVKPLRLYFGSTSAERVHIFIHPKAV